MKKVFFSSFLKNEWVCVLGSQHPVIIHVTFRTAHGRGVAQIGVRLCQPNGLGPRTSFAEESVPERRQREAESHGVGAGNALASGMSGGRISGGFAGSPRTPAPGLAPPFSGDSTWPAEKRGRRTRARLGRRAGRANGFSGSGPSPASSRRVSCGRSRLLVSAQASGCREP